MSNYPLGAKDDPKAPYNQEEVKISFVYAITCRDDIQVNKEVTEEERKEAICDYIKQKHGCDIEIEYLEEV